MLFIAWFDTEFKGGDSAPLKRSVMQNGGYAESELVMIYSKKQKSITLQWGDCYRLEMSAYFCQCFRYRSRFNTVFFKAINKVLEI